MFSTAIYRAYPSDLTDEQWEILEPLIPPLKADAAYHKHERREIVDAILYVLRSGCPWRMLPHDLPPYGTVHDYFRRWQCEGIWDRILDVLRMQMRVQDGRNEEPSAGVIDSQSIKTSSALRFSGEQMNENWNTCHHVLNRARWSTLSASQCLLLLIVETLVAPGGVHNDRDR